MKKLYLIRHAKSGWKEAGKTDHERALNHRGIKDAPFMANLLKSKGIKPDLILTSDAVRARTTAQLMAPVFGYPPEEILSESSLYLAGAHEILREVNLIDDKAECCFLVAHNPGISGFTSYITGSQGVDMPTCAVCGVEFDAVSWSDIKPASGKLFLYEFPKKYSGE